MKKRGLARLGLRSERYVVRRLQLICYLLMLLVAETLGAIAILIIMR